MITRGDVEAATEEDIEAIARLIYESLGSRLVLLGVYPHVLKWDDAEQAWRDGHMEAAREAVTKIRNELFPRSADS